MRLRRTLAALAMTLVAGGLAASGAPPAGAASFTVNTTVDSTDTVPGDGMCRDAQLRCSLRAAIQEANAAAGADTITLGADTYNLTILGPAEDAAATGDLDVTGALTITGPATPARATLSASSLGDRVFHVLANANLTVSDLTITGGTAGPAVDPLASGGGVLNSGTFTAARATISNSSANRAGGGIEGTAGAVTTLTDVILSGNTTGPSPGNGGGLHQTGAGTIRITEGQVTGNTAASEGGGLWNSAAATMTVTGTRIANNTAAGAVADNGGGGLFNDGADNVGGTLNVIDATISNNAATGLSGSGGGILNDEGTLNVEGGTIEANSAERAGGGIEANVGRTNLDGVLIRNNVTGDNPGNGGALHLTGAGRVDVLGGTITGNIAAAEGGGLWNSGSGIMSVSGVTLAANRANGTAADQGGGALYNDGGTLTAVNSTLSGNQATTLGGGVLTVGGSARLTNVTVANNTAPNGAGVAGVGTPPAGAVTLANSIVADNNNTDCSGNIASLGGNVVGPTCPLAGQSDRTQVTDARLGSLADNGGDNETLLPASTSPAIDNGLNANCPSVDQRGEPRPTDGNGDGQARCDSGAVELEAVPVTPPPATVEASRISGADRIDTAVEVSRQTFPGGAPQALLARLDAFPDALGGNYAAGQLTAPLLLSQRDSVPAATLAELDRLNVGTVVLLGGPNAISESVRAQLQAQGYTVNRLGGADRFETAAVIARNFGPAAVGSTPQGRTAVLSNGLNFADALSAGAVVYSERFPQLLTPSGQATLNGSAAQALDALGIQHVIITGGESAVSAGVEAQIRASGRTTERIAGSNRYDTAVLFARKAIAEFGFDPAHVNIATGENFPDALAGGPHAGAESSVILLTPRDAGSAPFGSTCSYLRELAGTVQSLDIFGGPGAIPEATVDALEACAQQ
jgi:CSLREA domain-containing protein